MEIGDSFIPTAGAVGLLPMVTYFFMVVAMLVFLGIFIAAYACTKYQPPGPQRLVLTLIAVDAAVSGMVYFLLQFYYHELLTELPAVTDVADRQTLIREAYNAFGSYRCMAWFITTPLLLLLVIAPLRLRWQSNKRLLMSLFVASLLLVFTGYIGSQQLSFDNEIQAGPWLGWGSLPVLCYGYISITFYRLWKSVSQANGYFSNMARLFVISQGIYIACYFLTLSSIDFNWIHLARTLTDVVSQAGIGLFACLSWSGRGISD